MQKKFVPFVFVGGLVGILVFQYKAVIPFAEKVASSSLFLVDSGDEGSRLPSSTEMTSYAFIQCNKEIRDEIDSEYNISFPTEPLQSWSLGNYRYIVNAEIELNSETTPTFVKKYACQIEYDNEADMEGIMDLGNWTLHGLSGISGL